MSKRKHSTKVSDCPITSHPKVRLASDAETDAIQQNFPKGIARPALRALLSAGLTSLDQLTSISLEELSALHGMGPKAVKSLQAGLLSLGLDFRTSTTTDTNHKESK
ncbi:hypothetical protein Pan258_27250 [Symmachiella dynata]|uniref:hypothetical protein n=1 Tax=Symmachiella dynata TaxID=2527995 RepID=UPI00118D05CC|nr:hypothetical protein [Symmachiella dynata]QDT48682.1 hypothetical protein Pan258_27250 [Symmachiella dynata]